MIGPMSVTVGSVRAAPGVRAEGVLEVHPPGVAPLELPLTVVAGSAPGPTLAVVAGLHGAEYCSIEAAIRFAKGLDPARLRGAVLVLPVVNLPAFLGRVAYLNPLDGKNVNRVFPGRADGSASEVLAHALMAEVVARADALVDLHGGDLVEALMPFTLYVRTGRTEVDARAGRMAHAFPVEHVVANPPAAPTATGLLYAEAARRGVPAIIAEAGGQGIVREPDVQIHLDGLRALLRVLGLEDGAPPAMAPRAEWTGFAWLRAPEAGCLHLTVAVGETLTEGRVVGELRDLYGASRVALRAPATGPVLFRVTSLAVNTGDPILGVATR
jgi:predicted deacylase